VRNHETKVVKTLREIKGGVKTVRNTQCFVMFSGQTNTSVFVITARNFISLIKLRAVITNAPVFVCSENITKHCVESQTVPYANSLNTRDRHPGNGD